MTLDSAQIQEIIPHRPPFLLVDEILELEEGVRATGVKRFTGEEAFFQGHFPGRPILPGVLLVEALAQVGSVALLSPPANRGKVGLFAGIESFRFRSPVFPGDTIRLEVQLTKIRGAVGQGHARATVEGNVVGEGDLLFVLATWEQVKRTGA